MPRAEIVEIEIERIGVRGDGIGHVQGEPIYVPFTAPGDVARVALGEKRGDGRVAALRELRISGARIAPPCGHFGACGGCALQHLDDAAYVAAKRQWLEASLAQHGLVPETSAALTRFAPATRRRARFKIERGRVGFHARASHHVVDLRECAVVHPTLLALLPGLRRLGATLLAGGGTATASATLAENGIDLLLDLPAEPALPQLEALARLAEEHDLARLSWRRRGVITPLAERRKPIVILSGVRVLLPEESFLQPSRDAEDALVAAVIERCDEARSIADLYAGIGTFTFALASRARVHAVEGAAAPIAALGQAARQAGIGCVSIEQRDLARHPLDGEALTRFDAVVFDPPYSGGREQARALAASRVKSIVAVSCNPATFARDARILVDGGYRLLDVSSFDAFLWSANLELVAGFRRD